MPKGDKPYFQFSKGINTEASLVNFPEGFSVDEENYDLFVDASRRKRRGIAPIAGGDEVQTVNNTSGATGTFYWDSVNGDSNTHFIVKQKGSFLNFYVNSSTTVAPIASIVGTIDLLSFAVLGAGATDVITNEIDIAFGRGKATVVGKFIEPFLVQYNPAPSVPGANFTTSVIDIIERDFKGVDDGLDMNQTTAAALTTSQTYNLTNRGWLDADIAAFKTALGYYPSKNLIPALGYIGHDAAGAGSTTAQADWTKQFSPAKLIAELFQNVSAPQGHLTIHPFVNTLPLANSGPSFPVTTWTISGTTPGSQSITITTASAHGLIVDSHFYWNGQTKFLTESSSFYGSGEDHPVHVQYSFAGSYVVTAVPTTTTLTFTVILSNSWNLWLSWTNQFLILGSIISQTFTPSNPTYTLARPEVTAFWAGRVFYTGIDDGVFASRIYVSQILENDTQYGQCMQVADPTDARISDIVPSDGGVLYIPEMATPKRAVIVGSYLIIFATNGVWQIGPGAAGFFSMTSYSVRKLADAGIVGKKAVVNVEQVPYYCGHNDIWRFIQDVQTGQLNPENVSEHTIHTLYTAIPNKQYIKMVYDDLAKKTWILYSNNAGYTYYYDRAFLLDMRISAITKHNFPMINRYVTDMATIRLETDKIKKILVDTFYGGNSGSSAFKWTFNRFSNSVETGGTYDDYGTVYKAYLLTSYDVVTNPVLRKQAPYVHVFSKRSESAFAVTTEYIPINTASTIVQARWDWADASVAGKWGMPQEAYRHRRVFTPDPTTPTVYADGVPLVITKNLIRGSGRTLQLQFSNQDQNKDSFLVGWSIHYSVTGNAT